MGCAESREYKIWGLRGTFAQMNWVIEVPFFKRRIIHNVSLGRCMRDLPPSLELLKGYFDPLRNVHSLDSRDGFLHVLESTARAQT